jgi:hypothetical protein
MFKQFAKWWFNGTLVFPLTTKSGQRVSVTLQRTYIVNMAENKTFATPDEFAKYAESLPRSPQQLREESQQFEAAFDKEAANTAPLWLPHNKHENTNG